MDGKTLNRKWKVGARDAKYRRTGDWYHQLESFPGAFFDDNGYIVFKTEHEYRTCKYLQIKQDVHVPKGISAIPGYVQIIIDDKEQIPSERIFGHIPGYPVGSHFESRKELSDAGVHRPTQAGISGSVEEGADSIVLSGGYEDDKDLGEVIIYTGHGGRDPNTGKQTDDQELTRGNLALAVSQLNGLPVRVVRGAGHKYPDAPKTGYRYDGLYRVEDHWREKGESGLYIWRFRLVKIADEDTSNLNPEGLAEDKLANGAPDRKASTVLRIIRDTKQSRRIKEIYDYCCQICGIRLVTAAGPYAAAAHIKPLGDPHNGPDISENILCLCPNHHVLFDLGAFSISEDLGLIGLNSKLTVHPEHHIGQQYLQYHREHYLNTINRK